MSDDMTMDECIDNGLADNAISRDTIALGANSIKRRVIADCRAHFEQAVANEVPAASAQVSRDREIWGDSYKATEAGQAQDIPNMSIGEVKGAIVQASKFGDQHQVKITPNNAEDIFKAMKNSPELQAEYGEQFAGLLKRPNLYFDKVDEPQLQRLAVEYLGESQNSELQQYAKQSAVELGIATGVASRDVGLGLNGQG